VYTAKASEPARGDANTFEIRKLDATIVANHYKLNMSLTIDERADLPASLVRQLA
jgi:hypothetical protein